MTFGLYLNRLFLLRLIVATLALAGLLQLVELMDKADEILARGLGTVGIVRFGLYRLPLLLGPVQPIAVLIAALLTWGALARRGEIAALRAAGVSVARLVAWLIPAGLAAAAAAFALVDQVAPAADAAFTRWWRATGPAESAPGGRLWFRDGMDVVAVDRVAADGRSLSGIELVRRQPDGRLAQWIMAERAEWRGGRWTLLAGGVRFPDGQMRPFDRMPWTTGLVPANLMELAQPVPPLLSSRRLVAALQGRWASRDSPQTLETRLMRVLAVPLAPLLMIVLATPVAGGTPRSGRIPGGMALGLAAGLSYLLLDGILGVLGEAGTLPPLLAAWLSHATFACVGGAMLLYVEG
ncbi:MAG: LptF/LptG family permease [Magnetospirillum sp.]|nr:LptF/LptG family permease [Magnetospirillum sp.]